MKHCTPITMPQSAILPPQLPDNPILRVVAIAFLLTERLLFPGKVVETE